MLVVLLMMSSTPARATTSASTHAPRKKKARTTPVSANVTEVPPLPTIPTMPPLPSLDDVPLHMKFAPLPSGSLASTTLYDLEFSTDNVYKTPNGEVSVVSIKNKPAFTPIRGRVTEVRARTDVLYDVTLFVDETFAEAMSIEEMAVLDSISDTMDIMPDGLKKHGYWNVQNKTVKFRVAATDLAKTEDLGPTLGNCIEFYAYANTCWISKAMFGISLKAVPILE